jgi:hypothetical protein
LYIVRPAKRENRPVCLEARVRNLVDDNASDVFTPVTTAYLQQCRVFEIIPGKCDFVIFISSDSDVSTT